MPVRVFPRGAARSQSKINTVLHFLWVDTRVDSWPVVGSAVGSTTRTTKFNSERFCAWAAIVVIESRRPRLAQITTRSPRETNRPVSIERSLRYCLFLSSLPLLHPRMRWDCFSDATSKLHALMQYTHSSSALALPLVMLRSHPSMVVPNTRSHHTHAPSSSTKGLCLR